MEIADVFVVNKADRPGVDATRRDLERMLDLSDLPHDAWRAPVVPTVATTREGIVEVWDAIRRPRERTTQSGVLTRTTRVPHPRGAPARSSPNACREKARDVCTGDRWDELERLGRRPHPRPLDRRRRDARPSRRLKNLCFGVLLDCPWLHLAQTGDGSCGGGGAKRRCNWDVSEVASAVVDDRHPRTYRAAAPPARPTSGIGHSVP